MQQHGNYGRHVIGLDLLRLAAALAVMCYHFGYWNWTPGQHLALALPGRAPAWGWSLHFGWVGVEVFFVISGFVIAYTAAGTTRTAFLRSRILRLAPVSWLAASVVLVVFLWLNTRPAGQLLLLYVGTLLFWPLNAIDGVWWTLGIEVDFYLLTFLLIRRKHLLEPVTTAIGLLSGLFWSTALALQVVLPADGGWTATMRYLVLKAEGNRELQLLLLQHGCLFALGVVLWMLTAVGVTRQRLLAAATLTGACLLEIVGQNGIIARASSADLPAAPALIAWSLAMVAFVLSVLFNDRLAFMLGRLGPLVRFAGLMTYPLYLLHNAVGIGVSVLLASWLGVSAVPVALAAAVASAAVTAGAVEPRLRRLLAAYLPRSWSASAAIRSSASLARASANSREVEAGDGSRM